MEMSESNAETLQRALEGQEEVRVHLEGVGEVEGKPFQQELEPPKAGRFDGVHPPHGYLNIDVAVTPDDFPNESQRKPTNLAIGFPETRTGEWGDGTATWATREEVSADSEETAGVENVKVVNDG